MGGKTSKVKDSTANVLNVVEVMDTTPHLETQTMLISLLVVLTAVNLILKFYLLYKRTLKKRYISRANDLDKI